MDTDNLESNREEEVVILKTPPPPKKGQMNQRIHHFFTFNNYDRDHIYFFCKVFDELCYMYAFQEEIGTSGTPHLQGIISLKKRARDSEFGLPKGIHWEKPSDIKNCYLYCTKLDTRNGDVFTKNYEIPYVFKLNTLFDWQMDIINLIEKPSDDRTINWFWSNEGGIGKSCFIKHCCSVYNIILCSRGKYNDITNLIYKSDMNKNNIVIFDLPRNNGNSISYDSLESIKNGMIVNMKYETGFKIFMPPKVLVFANSPPDIDRLSEDRWNIVNLDNLN